MSVKSAVSTRATKVRAILAGGLVLGLGATVVMAAWNDSEFGSGTFTAGTFDVQGSTDGVTYTSHATAPGATLGFTVSPDNLAPGQTVYAPFALRLAAGTTTDATVTINAATASGTVTGLTYELIQTAALGCDAGTAGTATNVPAGSAITAAPASPEFTLTNGATTATAGDPAYFCFRVTAGTGLVQGQTGTATWQFAAASAS